MKKSKRIISALVAVLLLVTAVLSLASCGEDVKLGFKDGTFKIGATGPLTGDNSAYGIAVRNGAVIAIEEINAKGGLNGFLFSFDMKDDEAGATKAQDGYFTLYENGMQASIGSVTSGSCKSFVTSAQENGVFSLTPSASAEEVIKTGDKIFRVCFGDAQQGEIAAEKLQKTYAKIGVIYDESDTYSKGLYEAFVAKMSELGKADAYVTKTFDSENATNFSAQVTALKSAGCEVIFLPIYYKEAGLIAKEAAKQSFNVPIFGCDGLDSVKGQLDSTVTADVSYCAPFDVNGEDEVVKSFVAHYTEKFGSEPNQFAADGYDAVMVIYEAMKAADVKEVDISAEKLGALLSATLTGGDFTYTGVTGKDMTWEANGSCNKDPIIVEVKR